METIPTARLTRARVALRTALDIRATPADRLDPCGRALRDKVWGALLTKNWQVVEELEARHGN